MIREYLIVGVVTLLSVVAIVLWWPEETFG